MTKRFHALYEALLSDRTKEKSEQWIIYIAIGSFLLHLALILINDSGLYQLADYSGLLTNPISAIYTPFSFILIYEVYLLVYYLPQSFTNYIGKQYEIITLIIIRRLFKDLANLELTSEWFQVQSDIQFTYDLIAALLLFFLIYLFYRLSYARTKYSDPHIEISQDIRRFIRLKKTLALILVPLLVALALYTLYDWLRLSFFSIPELVSSIKDINSIFYDEFFTVLILVDVLLLLFSFTHTDRFHTVIRNSGFVISTILIRLSFGVTGLVNAVLIVIAVAFGVLILLVHNQYEKVLAQRNDV